MKTISKLVFSAVAILATMGFSAGCYATVEEVDLPCCTEGTCPTKFESPGIPGVIQTATFEGVSVFVNGTRTLLTIIFGDPNYKQWREETCKPLDKETAGKLVTDSRTTVYAQCSSNMAGIHNLGKIKTLTCLEGDWIFLKQDGPNATCADPKTGPRSRVKITKVSRAFQEAVQNEIEIKLLEKEIAALNQQDEELAADHEERQRRIRGYNAMLQQSAYRLAGGGSSSVS